LNISANQRLLVFDCHEAWVYQLHWLGMPMDIVVGLKGRATSGWDEAMRPVPPNARLVRLEEVLTRQDPYACIIAHNLSDLLDAKTLSGPRLFVIHAVLDGIVAAQPDAPPADILRRTVAQYLHLTATHAIAVSALKGRSWGLGRDIVPFSAEASDYLPYGGELPRGLRIANQIRQKSQALLWHFHQRAFSEIPVTLVGRNDDMPGVEPARDWADLKGILSKHRFFIHTADPRYEDGYNMATLEAMAAGLPVLGNRHPSSPITHGVSGFLSDDPVELRWFAMRLLHDHDLAAQMGRAARDTVVREFSPQRFKDGLTRAIATAQQMWRQRMPARAFQAF
jgi:glycosyltransferase involved in cell wall biosynthesis